MGRSLMERGSVAMGFLSLMITIFLAAECSGNPVIATEPSQLQSRQIVEIAGMAAAYDDDLNDRGLVMVVNEYELDETNSIFGSMRIGYARLGSSGRQLVRQSICFDRRDFSSMSAMQAPLMVRI